VLASVVAIALLGAPGSSDRDGTIVVHVADDDAAAAHELAALVERHGRSESPPMRVSAPQPNLSRVEAAKLACTGDVLGVFWLDARRTDEWRLYAVPCATKRPLLREIVVSEGAEQASIEASWLITRSSAVAIAHGLEIAMEEAPPEPKPKPEPAPEPKPMPKVTPTLPPPQKSIGLLLSLGYAGETLGREVPWRSGAFGAIAWAARPRLRIGGWYEFVGRGRLDDPSGFTAWHHAIAITIAAALPIGRHVILELRGGPELELARWRTTDDGKGPLRAIPRVGADATLQIGLTRPGAVPRASLDLGVGAAATLIDVDFVTCAAGAADCTGAGRRVVLDAWRVRPRGRAGISVQF
jgi:hypothetical protein